MMPGSPLDDLAPMAGAVTAATPEAVISTAAGGALALAGEITVLAADGGAGKSTLVLGLARIIASGESSAAFSMQQGGVLVVAAEENPATVRDRLGAYKGVIRVFDLRAQDRDRRALWRDGREAGGMPLVEAVLKAMHKAGEKPKLLVLDTLLRCFDDPPDNDQRVVAFLDQLGALARRQEVALLGLAHSEKSIRSLDLDPMTMMASGRVAGSAQWTDAPRTVLSLTNHEFQPGGQFEAVTRHARLTVLKSNVTEVGLTLKMRRGARGFAPLTDRWIPLTEVPDEEFSRSTAALYRLRSRK